jgi:acetyl esterase/lipase
MAVISPRRARNALRLCAKRNAQAQFGDYVIAACSATASVPVIGRRLEPVASIAALGVWAGRLLPGLVAAGKAAENAVDGDLAREERAQTTACLRAALQDVVPADQLDAAWPLSGRFAPFFSATSQRKHVLHASIRYGRNADQLLDVWRRADLPTTTAPVLIFVPGGAWVFGSRLVQGHELMSRLVQMGWICLSVQYRTSPLHRWPRQITDVKAAIAWARANIERFGGDPRFIAVAGCSAGGHLASLAGLTPNDPDWQRDLAPDADTSVDAVVSVYGRYDWQDQSTPERARFVEFLERVVVKRSQARDPEAFSRASPLARVSAAAPPFLVMHGSRDVVIPVSEARQFVERLQAVSSTTVCYAELPGAQHGFDLIDAGRTSAAVHAIGLFLDRVYRGPRTPVGEVV